MSRKPKNQPTQPPQKPRDIKEIQAEYQSTAAEVGHRAYQVEKLQGEIRFFQQKMHQLNLESQKSVVNATETTK